MLHETRNDLPKATRTKVIALLNQSLADLIDLQAQTKQAHWSVKGPNFIALHELYDQTAGAIEEHVDDVAERITALGGTAEGDLRHVVKRSSLRAYPENVATGIASVAALADAVALVAKHTRAAIDKADDLGDACTADLYTQVTRDLDKRLWFIEAHLQAKA